MEFLILSRQQAESGEHIPCGMSHIIISITNPVRNEAEAIVYPPADIPANPDCKDILRLTFWDIDHRKEGLQEIFTRKHALWILRLVKAHQDVDLIVAHCEAGRSRSAGTIAALAKLYGYDDTPYFTKKTPNMLVYRTILNAAHDLKLEFE